MSSRPELKLDWCSHAAAKYAVEKWHYSRTMPMPPLVKIGVWEEGRFIGVVLFSRGASPYLGDAYGLDTTKVCELTRIALASHQTPVSRIIAIALRMLFRKDGNLRLVVSFADANEGHHGGVYQAAGWVYAGETSRKFDFLGPDGKRYRDRQVTASGQARQFGKQTRVLRPDQCTPLPLMPKHKYLYPLDREMRERILPLAKPYPKRAGSIGSDVSGFQPEEGGASPTPALHESSHA